MRTYILDKNGDPVYEPDLLTWALWFETAKRQVADTTFAIGKNLNVQISTVFLGIDSNYGNYQFSKNEHPPYPPILWETMVFGGRHHHLTKRYPSRHAAELGHAEICAMVQKEESQPWIEWLRNQAIFAGPDGSSRN